MICPNCGKDNPEGATFCPNCGTSLQGAGSAAGAGGAVPPQAQAQPQYNQTPPTTPPPVYNGAPTPAPGGIKNRNIALCIILSIITCGIYGLYWLYTLTEDVNTLYGDPNATSGGIVILLSIVTCSIYLWYWLYKQGDKLDQIKIRYGMASGNSGILYLILGIVGLSVVSYALMQNELNKFATA